MQNSPSWQVVLRALYALEAVLTRGSSQACGEVAVMFQSDPSSVTRAASSSQSAVKDRAQRCLKLLLNEDAPVAHSSLQVCGLLGGDQFALCSVLARLFPPDKQLCAKPSLPCVLAASSGCG